MRSLLIGLGVLVLVDAFWYILLAKHLHNFIYQLSHCQMPPHCFESEIIFSRDTDFSLQLNAAIGNVISGSININLTIINY